MNQRFQQPSSASARMGRDSVPFLMLLLGILLWMTYMVFTVPIIAWQDERRYDEFGVSTVGKIVGYRYWDGGSGRSGSNYATYYANVSFMTPSATVTASMKVEPESRRKALLGTEVAVRYLSEEPQKARVVPLVTSWSDILLKGLPLAGLLLFVNVWLLRLIWQAWKNG